MTWPPIFRLQAESTSQIFKAMLCFGEGIANGKHVVQAADQSAQTGERSTERSKRKGRLFDLNQLSSILSTFVT